VLSLPKAFVVALQTKTLLKTIPAHYHEAYRRSKAESTAHYLSAFPLLMVLAQVVTFLLFIGLPKSFSADDLLSSETIFSFFSLFYCIVAILSSHLFKIARKDIQTDLPKAERLLYAFLFVFTILESSNISLTFAHSGMLYRYVGVAFIIALAPLYRRRGNIAAIVLLGVLTSISTFVAGRGTDTWLQPVIVQLLVSFLAVVCSCLSHNNKAAAFINNRNITEANQQLAEANNQLETANNKLEQISTTDPLTQVSNRRAFDNYMMHAWDLCQRGGHPVTVLMIDIDHFKAYNDEFGHIKGDECLYRVAQMIKSHFNRAVDLFARYGGEEFVAILPFTTGASVMNLVEHVRNAVEAMKLPNPKSASSQFVTISIGVAERVPSSDKPHDYIVSLADEALYEAKRTGRNRVVSNLSLEDATYVSPNLQAIALPGAGEDLEKLQAIVSMAMIAIFSIDAETGQLSFSKNIIDFTGISSSELVDYRQFLVYIHPDDADTVTHVMQRLLMREDERAVITATFRLRGADGLFTWVSMTCSYMRRMTAKAETLIVIGAIADATEQMRAQEMTDLVADGSDAYLYSFDFARQDMFFSEAFRADYELADSVAANGAVFFSSLVYEPERPLFHQAFEALESGDETSFTVELRLLQPSKGARWVRMRGLVRNGINGRPSMFAGSILDIHELVSLRQTYRLMIEGCADCAFVYDAENDTIEMSSKVTEIVPVPGLQCDNALQMWTDLIVPEDRYVFLDSIRLIREGKADSQRLEFRAYSITGEPIWLASRGKAAFDDEGNFMRLAGSLFNISAMGHHNSYVAELAMADRLTGLPNRLALYRDMNIYLPIGTPGYIIMLDVDDFKNVNSMYGLAIGDRMLTELSALITLNVPTETGLYHLGGDLFILHLKHDDAGHAFALAEQLSALASAELPVDDSSLRFTFSIGVVRYTNDHTIDEIITNAEIANRKAKSGGKNRVAVFDPADKNDYLQRLALETQLRECVENSFEGFCTFFQPLYATDQQTIIGAEALLRWRDENGRVMLPNIVIPCLQNIGLFSTVESWVLRSAAAQCGKWITSGAPKDFIINVNLSPSRAIEPSLLSEVNRVIRDTGLRPQNIVLEITEESLILEMKVNIPTLRTLQQSGVLLAIDDFGTGYSSLSYLRDLPINELKIDRSFIADLESNQSSRDFVRSIILLSRSMGYIVCVEGAETKAQVDILTELGADILQGYYFSRPIPANEFAAKFLNQ